MKKLISIGLLCILVSISLMGCAIKVPPVDGELSNGQNQTDSIVPPQGSLPPNDNNSTGENNSTSQEHAPPIVQPPSLPPTTPNKEYDILVKSKVNSLNVRVGAGSGYAVIGSINANDMLDYVSESGDWYKVRYKRSFGYVSRKHTTLEKFEKSTSKVVEDIIHIGKGLMGYPYVWGAPRYHWGNGILNPNFVQGKYDCSSLVQYMFYIGGGVVLDVNTRTQVVQGKEISKSDIRRGDVLFFTNSDRYHLNDIERVGHVAVYLGNNYILHTASDYAVIEPISNTRWSHYIVAKRMV